MASILIIGPVGSGKTTGAVPNQELDIVGLPYESTVIIECAGPSKEPPIRGWRKKYNADQRITEGGRFLATRDVNIVGKAVKYIIASRPDVKTVVIDDADYLMTLEVVGEVRKLEYDDWRELAQKFIANVVLPATTSTRADLNFVFCFHSETNKHGQVIARTAGAMVDNYLGSIEGLFTYVFYADPTTMIVEGKMRPEYRLLTQRVNGLPAKTPHGLYSELYIQNDYGRIFAEIKRFQEGDEE